MNTFGDTFYNGVIDTFGDTFGTHASTIGDGSATDQLRMGLSIGL